MNQKFTSHYSSFLRGYLLLSLVVSHVTIAHAKNGEQQREPQIVLSSASKAGSFYSDEFTISGRIKGSGIKDAAVYVGEKRLSTLPINFHYQNSINSPFTITIDASEEPELRIVTNSGSVIREKIDVLNLRE